MTYSFKDINVLGLYPTEVNNFQHRFARWRPHFKSLHSINYLEACLTLGVPGAQRLIRETVRQKDIGLVLACPFATDYQLPVEFYASLRGLSRLVFWFADDASYFDSFDKYYAQTADAVLTADPLAVFAYRRLEIPALAFQDVDPGNDLSDGPLVKDLDVSFVGDMRKRGRREYIEALSREGYSVAVYGHGAEKGRLPGGNVSALFRRTRINLNFSQINGVDWRNGDDPLLNRVRQNTGRPVEIATTGSFCLSEYSPALGSLFALGEEIDCFSDAGELLEKVRFYLANPERREAMAQAARRRVEKDYSESACTEKMLEGLAAALKQRSSAPHKIYLSRDFMAREINSLTFSLLLMLLRGRWLAALRSAGQLLRRGPGPFLRGCPAGIQRAARLLLAKLDRAT